MSAAKAKTATKSKTSKAKEAAKIPPANNIESFTGRKRVRRNFGRINEVADMPNLIEVQRRSYELFLQDGIDADDRKLEVCKKSSRQSSRSKTSPTKRKSTS